MSKGLKITLIVLGVLAVSALLVGGGIALGRTVFNHWRNDRSSMMGNRTSLVPNPKQGHRLGPGSMDRRGINPEPRARGNYGMGMMGGSNKNYTGTPLTMDEARQSAQNYVTSLNNPDLTLKEVMVFNNNAYGLIAEKSTDKGALEVLVDPVSKSVIPEIGPGRMWNLKYNTMGAGGCGRSWMGSNTGACASVQPSTAKVAEMTIPPSQATQSAQDYLDKNIPGTKAASNPVTFYGYYTLDYTKDGKPVGMLSVNGYTGQVWPHTWHGIFIEEWQAQ